MGLLFKSSLASLCLAFAMAATPADSDAATKKKPAKKTAPAAAYSPPHSAIAINGETGEILICDKCDQKREPASLTKLMTAMVVFDAIREEKFKLSDRFKLESSGKAGANGAVALHRGNASRKAIPVGTELTVDELLSATAITSAADATITLSKAVCGTEDCIVDLMNKKVREILPEDGVYAPNTQFDNPHGMPSKAQYSTAYDQAIILQYMVKNYFEEYRAYFGETSYTIGKQKFAGHNALLVDYMCKDFGFIPYRCMEGGKTGYFRAAGSSLAASAAWNNWRVIAVEMGARNATERNAAMVTLFDRGFKMLEESNAPRTVDMPRHFFPPILTPRVVVEPDAETVPPSPTDAPPPEISSRNPVTPPLSLDAPLF